MRELNVIITRIKEHRKEQIESEKLLNKTDFTKENTINSKDEEKEEKKDEENKEK